MTKFPGHDGMDANGSFQFVEGEYMKVEDYDAFIHDPGDWAIRKYWPRVFKELEGLALLPPLGLALRSALTAWRIPSFLKVPPVAAALKALAAAADAQAAADARAMATLNAWQLSVLSLPHLWEFLSKRLLTSWRYSRGMRGIMLDLYRGPEKAPGRQEKSPSFRA